MNRVQIIAPTKVDSILDKDLSSSRIKRTAAQCRVSTSSEEQATSFDNQVEEWTRRILENPDYKLVKVYSDSGISGTSAKGREGFQEMIRDAKAGKIDLILVKSISRFARNTVLTIQTIRELKEYGVEVYFDNENLSTFDAKNEFMFSIISSMAQMPPLSTRPFHNQPRTPYSSSLVRLLSSFSLPSSRTLCPLTRHFVPLRELKDSISTKT